MKTIVTFREKLIFSMNRRNLNIIVVLLAVIFYSNYSYSQTAVTKTFSSGSGSWTVPYGVTSITVKCWGGGGAGGGSTSNGSYGSGGGGGGYTYQVISVVAGDSFTYSVGSGGTASTGAGTTGGNTSFIGNGYTLAANGGGGGAANGGAAGSGGTASGGSTNTSGNTGGTSTTNAGGSSPNGGSGGTAPGANADGNAGSAPGGGGSGSEYGSPGNRSGGAGGTGRITVDFTYTQNTYTMGTTGSQSATITNNSEDTPDKFYDNGGTGSNYSNNVNATYTFNCAANKYVRLKLNSGTTETSFDYFYVYDGTSNTAPLIGGVGQSGTLLNIMVVSTTGSLTVEFISDNTNVYSGWSIDVWIDSYAGQIWKGTSSTEISSASNWEGSVAAGEKFTSIYIPSGTTYSPDITNTTAQFRLHSIYVETGATLTFSSTTNAALLYGNLTNNGTINVTGAQYFQINGGSSSNYATIYSSGTMTTLNVVVGYNRLSYYKLMSNISVDKFLLHNNIGNSILDMNDYNLTASTTLTINSSTTFYQKSGTLTYAGSTTTSIDNTSFNENTGTTVFSRAGTQTIPAITYYNLSTSGAGTKTFAASTVDVDGAVNIGSTSTLATGNFNCTVAGNWVNDGTFTQGTGTVTFDGTSTISGSSTTTFYNLTITGTLTGVSSGNFNVSRDWTNASGTYNHNNGTVTFTGTSVLTTGGNTASKKFYNVTLNGTSATLVGNIDIDNALTLTSGTFSTSGSNYSMNVGGNWANAGTFTVNSSTVTFDGTSTVSGASATTFYDLIISGSLTGHATSMNVSHDYTNNGTFIHNSGVVVFNGSVAQALGGSASTTFYSLTMNNSSASGVTLGVNTTINNTLTLTDGLLYTVSYTLILGTNASNATVPAGSSASYIVAFDNGGTIGYVKQFVNSNATYNFPIGENTKFTPLTFTLNSNGGLSSANLIVYTKNAKITGMNTGISTYISRFWEVTDNGFTSPNYNISYVYVDADITGTEANLLPIKLSGTTWYKPIGSAFTTGTAQGTGSVTVGTNTLTWTSLTTFSFFGGGGDQGVALPVELLAFDAKKYQNDIKTSWKTASEINNDYFTVERSENGIDFDKIAEIDGAGNSTHLISYFYLDSEYKNGVNYYRLKQTDYNGNFSYSNIVAVDVSIQKGVKVMTVNTLGQEVNETFSGVVFDIFSDGTSVKRIQ